MPRGYFIKFVDDNPRFGQAVHAEWTGEGENLWGHAKCWQDGKLVYEQYVKLVPGQLATFTLGPTPNWSSGPAEGELSIDSFARRQKTLTTTEFDVLG